MLLKRELKRNLKAFIVTTFICTLLSMYVVSMSPTFGTDIQKIIDMKMPKELQNAIGLKGLDYNKAESFFAMAFSYIYLFLAIYVAGAFAGIVSKEFSDKTAEYLFSLPARRVKIILTKLSVISIYTVASVIIIFLGTWLAFEINIKDAYNLKAIALMSFAWLIGGLFFGALSFLISSFLTKSKSASITSIGVVIVMYLLQVVISMNSKIDFLKYISPFDWFKGSEIARYCELDLVYSLIAIALSLICFVIGIRRYNKMDVLV